MLQATFVYNEYSSDRPSQLREAILDPSKWPVQQGSVRTICGPLSRQTANGRRPAGPLHYCTWPVYCPPT